MLSPRRFRHLPKRHVRGIFLEKADRLIKHARVSVIRHPLSDGNLPDSPQMSRLVRHTKQRQGDHHRQRNRNKQHQENLLRFPLFFPDFPVNPQENRGQRASGQHDQRLSFSSELRPPCAENSQHRQRRGCPSPNFFFRGFHLPSPSPSQKSEPSPPSPCLQIKKQRHFCSQPAAYRLSPL